MFRNYPVIPFTPLPLASFPTTPPYFSASAFRSQSCSINCCARARTRSSLSSKARINGSIAPGGADCAQVSRAWSRTRTFGELSLWAIHSGTTKPATECPGSEDKTGTAWGFSPPGTVPVPDMEPVPFSEARGVGLAAEVNASLFGDGPCLDMSGPLTLARSSRLDALSDEAGPQPASPTRSSRLRNSPRCGQRADEGTVVMDARDGCMASNLSHVHSDENISGENARYKPTLSIVNCVDLLSIYADICKVFWTYSKNGWNGGKLKVSNLVNHFRSILYAK